VVMSRQAVGPIRLPQSPRCSGRRSLRPSSTGTPAHDSMPLLLYRRQDGPALRYGIILAARAICKTLCPNVIRSPPRSRVFSGFSAATKPRSQSARARMSRR
jgi:hypothetical protein